jgi:hypothetical protein
MVFKIPTEMLTAPMRTGAEGLVPNRVELPTEAVPARVLSTIQGRAM